MITKYSIDVNLDTSKFTPLNGKINVQYIKADKEASFENNDVSNTPILMLHDSLGSIALWKNLPQEIANFTNHDVIVYDRIGFGESTARIDELKLNFINQEAEEIIPIILDYFKLDEFIVLGHSVGGVMACVTSSLFPGHCKGLIAISTQAFNDEKIRDGIHKNYNDFMDENNFIRLEKYHGEKTKWVLDAWKNTWINPEFLTWSLIPYIKNITTKTLVIQGELDEYNDPIHSRTISENIINSELLIIPNSGHFPHRQDKDLVINKISNFIREID